MRWALGIACLVLLSGCVPCSDAPLSQPGAQPLDSSLMGVWSHTDGGSTVTLHFGIDTDTQLLTIVMTETDKAGKLDSSKMTAHTTRAGDKSYLNIRFGDENATEPGYLFVKYTVEGDTLGVAIIDADAVTKAIQLGEVEGEVTDGQWASSIRIKDTPENIISCLDRLEGELFHETQHFQKLKPSDAR